MKFLQFASNWPPRRNKKESMHSIQIESQTTITELTAMVGSMDNLSAEVDRLAAENASLTYELGVKSTENNEHLTTVKSLQMELDTAKCSYFGHRPSFK